MNDFIASEERPFLERHGLASFEALWALKLEAVDEPNTGRGGWSTVYRLDLEGRGYYLKRQNNYLTRSLSHPFGEPTLAREFRNIRRYQALGIPVLQAVFFARRARRAVLLTRALDGWRDLDEYLAGWPQLPEAQRAAVLHACGELARRLHTAGQMHGCFYPKHIFLREVVDGYEACLIDLEKTRPMLLGWRDRIKDIDPLLRRARIWNERDVDQFFEAYRIPASDLQRWKDQLSARREDKESRS